MKKSIISIAVASMFMAGNSDAMEDLPKSDKSESASKVSSLPYITAGQMCPNHGYLSIKVQVVSTLNEKLFREDGEFRDITHISTVPHGGAYTDETYRVNGGSVVLRKTILQNGHPWVHPSCYLVAALQKHAVSAETLITKLLGRTKDEYIP